MPNAPLNDRSQRLPPKELGNYSNSHSGSTATPLMQAALNSWTTTTKFTGLFALHLAIFDRIMNDSKHQI